MFGGLALMVEGKMCVCVGKASIMCRIDPAMHDAALKRNGCTTVEMKGREYRGYVHIAADALKGKTDLDYWVALALDYNGHAKAAATEATPKAFRSRSYTQRSTQRAARA